MKFLSNLFGGSKEDKALRFCRKKSSEWKSELSMAQIAISKISEQIHIKNSLILWLIGLTCFLAVPAWADNYEVNLTRKSGNVYKVDGKDIIIQTRYCYVYSYSEEAIFKTSGYGGEIIFFDSKDKCDVKAVFGVSTQKPGKYVVTVSHEDDDWYEMFGTNSYIKTSSCLSLALGEEAYLTIASSGFGRLRFKDGNDCMVEGIYTKLRL